METSKTGQTMMDAVLQFFAEENRHYAQTKDPGVVRTSYHSDRGTWVCFARVDSENERFVFYSLTGMNIPREYRSKVNEYLNRVNYILQIGNFEINMDNGDVRFRTSTAAPAGELKIEAVRALVSANIEAMNRYIPGVMAVIHAGLTPEAALARIEMDGVITTENE